MPLLLSPSTVLYGAISRNDLSAMISVLLSICILFHFFFSLPCPVCTAETLVAVDDQVRIFGWPNETLLSIANCDNSMEHTFFFKPLSLNPHHIGNWLEFYYSQFRAISEEASSIETQCLNPLNCQLWFQNEKILYNQTELWVELFYKNLTILS